jgi:hypothetical protein
MFNYNNQLSRLGEVKPFMALLDTRMRKWFDDRFIITPEFNFSTYLHNLYTTQKIRGRGEVADMMKREDQLTNKEQYDLYLWRLRQIIDEYKNNGMEGSTNFQEELNIIKSALDSLSMADVYRREINTHEKFNPIDLQYFGVQNIGEANNKIVQEHIIKAEKKIVAINNKLRVIRHKALKAWTDAIPRLSTTLNLKGYTLVDRSQKRYERIYAKEITNGKEWRNGNIYYTNKVVAGMNEVQIKMAKRAKELGLTNDELAAGKQITDYVEQMMIDNVMTVENNYKRNYAFDRKTDKDLTKAELEIARRRRAKEKLYTNSKFYRGFVPVMSKTADERLSKFNIGSAYTTALSNMSDIETMFEDATTNGLVKKETIITELKDRMFSQIGYGSYSASASASSYGSAIRNKMLGIKLTKMANGKVEWQLDDEKANNALSYNLENVLDYFTAATIRIPIIEQEVLPVINGVILWLKTVGEQRHDPNAKPMADFIEGTRDFQILNRRKQVGGKFLGINRDKLLSMISAIATPAVMAGSVTVPAISATSNIINMTTFGLSNRLAGTNLFTDGDISRALSYVYSTKNRGLVKQISAEYGVTNSTEYETVHLATLKLYDKKLISQYMLNYPNRLTDIETRLIIMTAQMIKDGSFEAHSLDKDGHMVYDKSKDKRWTGKGGKEMRIAMEKRMDIQGLSLNDRAYDYNTANTLKALGDMFGPGEFDKNVSNAMSQYSFARAAAQFTKWFTARWFNAFGTAGTFRVAGEVLTSRTELDENGKEIQVAYFEKLAGEGYANTAWKWLIHTATHYNSDDRVKYSELESWQRANIARFGVIMSTVAISAIAQQLLSEVDLGDDDKTPVTETTVGKAVFRGADSLLALWNMINWMTRPFAAIQITKNAFVGPFGDPNLSNSRNLIPGIKFAKFTNDLTEYYTGNPIVPDL